MTTGTKVGYRLDDEEVPQEAQSAAIEQIVRRVRALYLQAYQNGPRPARRFAHAKAHGCLRAEFEVLPGIPDELKVGLFKEAKTYPALIRFSNGRPKVRHDLLPDLRGMAIKILELPDPAAFQDFVLANFPVFFVRNAEDFAKLASRMTGLGLPLSFFFGRWHEFGILIQSSLKWVPSVLDQQYWSGTPYRFGACAAKFSARPLLPAKSPGFSLSANYLRTEIIRRLRQDVVFEFCVQLRTHSASMPIDDATVIWPETLSPFRRVALIKIRPQDFNTPEQLALEERISMAPWHALPEHAPLGEINSIRKELYVMMANLRNGLNANERNSACS